MALRDLFPTRRRVEAASGLAVEWRRALDDLRSLAIERPELATASRTLGGVIEAAFGEPDDSADDSPHAEIDVLVAAWRAGVPAFRAGDSPPRLDPERLRRCGLRVCEAVGRRNPNAAVLSSVLKGASADLHFTTWAQAALSGQVDAVDGSAQALGVDPAFARSVLRLVLLPSLAARSRRLDALRPEGIWVRGDCPNCGGAPTLAESRGLEQRRAWRCGLCAADWPGDRLRCPFCGETDHRKLHYRFVEGEQERFRLGLCDACGGRLPVMATLGPISAPGLLVAELASAHLEAAAIRPEDSTNVS